METYSETNAGLHYGTGLAAEDNGASAHMPAAFMDDDDPPAFAETASEEADKMPLTIGAGTAQDIPQAADAQTGVPAQAEDKDAQRKAHEEAEAKRKAEFDARQAEKKAAEQAQIERINAMSDDEVLAASMQRVSTDTEKLTRRNMKECVTEHIQTLCIADPAFARKAMHPRKSMIRCFQYISRKAWEYIQDELKANGLQPNRMREPYGADVPDDLCYQWAEDYFNNPEAKEDHEDDEEFVPKPYYGGTASKSKSGAKSRGKAGKKDTPPQKADEKKTGQKPGQNSGGDSAQISLGDFAVPEGKAG